MIIFYVNNGEMISISKNRLNSQANNDTISSSSRTATRPLRATLSEVYIDFTITVVALKSFC
jgi:hypothetical protein